MQKNNIKTLLLVGSGKLEQLWMDSDIKRNKDTVSNVYKDIKIVKQ